MRFICVLCLGVMIMIGCKHKAKNDSLPVIDIDAQAKIEAQIQKDVDSLSALPPEPDKRGVESEPAVQAPE